MLARFHRITLRAIILTFFASMVFSEEHNSLTTKTQLNIDSVIVEKAGAFLQFPVRGLASNLKAYEDSSNQIHPDIVFDSVGWPPDDSIVLPWKYWIVVTPMISGENYENPHLFASNDGLNWIYNIGRESGDSIGNPVFTHGEFQLDTVYLFSSGAYKTFYDTTNGNHDSVYFNIRARHLSDGDILLGHDRKLWMFFRVSFSIGATDMSAIFAAYTSNGLEWSNPKQITRLGRFLSPAVVQESQDRYSLFASIQKDSISGIINERDIYKFQAERPDTIWEFLGHVNLPVFRGFPWHIDVLPRKDGELIMIINSKQRAALWLAVSYNNGQDWGMAKQPFMTSPDDESSWDAILYRASGYWKSIRNHPTMGLYYSAYSLQGESKKITWHTGFAKIKF